MKQNLRVQTEFMMWGGCSPTLSTMQGGNQEPKILEVKQLGFMDNGTGKHQSNTVYDENAICPNITTVEGGGTQQIKVCESQIVAMRGRNPDNASDRTVGSPTEQRLELNKQGTSNCLTTPILVRDYPTDCWHKAHFAKYKDGNVLAFKNGKTSWSVDQYSSLIEWKYAKLAESEE